MKQSQSISNSLLHAFVDDELDARERQLVLDAMATEPAVAKEVSELYKLKALLKAARPAAEASSGPLAVPRQTQCLGNYRCAAIAACLVLVSAVVTGLFLARGDISQPGNKLASYPDVKQFIASHPANENMRVVLHINRDDKVTVNKLFLNLSLLLQTQNKDLRVEVVASGPGLSLVRQNKSPYPQKIREIRKQHDNVAFVACQSTLNRLSKALNIKIQLIPEAMLTASGPEMIALRKSQGWAYIQI